MKTITLQVNEPERLALVAALKAYQRSCVAAADVCAKVGGSTSQLFLVDEALTARRLVKLFEVAR